jgi:PAS domain S-box-containing protein
MITREPLEQLIAHAPVAIGMFDRDMRYIVASRRWIHEHKLDDKNIVGRSYYELSPTLPDAWKTSHRRGLAGERLPAREDSFVSEGGARVWVRWEIQPWFAPDGSVAGIIIFTEDITARKEAEQAAHAAAARVRAILETSSDAIITFNRSGLIEDANAATEAVLGYAPGALLNRSIRSLVPSPSRDRAEHYIDHCLRSDDARIVGNAIETEVQRCDGTLVPVELSIGEIDDLGLFTANIRDISKRKKAEQALRDSHAELERHVEERTRALEAAKQEAERANAFKMRFLAAASHDLRQPLQSLGLYLSVLERQLHEPAPRAICAKMAQSRDAVTQILEALLDVSKLESGAVRPQKQEFALQPLLERVLADSRQQAESKGLQLSAQSTNCIVHSDPALLERIVENLVTNAIRYTERGHVTVSCEIAGAVARIAVSDSGIGIPSAALDKIFDEYFQVASTTRSQRQGLGLGLSIVKHISRLLEHPIEVSSTPGRGSTFTITVPLGQQTLAAAEQTPAEPAEPEQRRDAVVLLIDDEPAIVDATTLLLQAAGLTVHSAPNGGAATSLLAAGVHPDMLICDYRLPGANGAKVIRMLRELAKAEVPAILLTGDTSRAEIERACVPHCVVLHKPVDAGRLLETIETSLHAHE